MPIVPLDSFLSVPEVSKILFQKLIFDLNSLRARNPLSTHFCSGALAFSVLFVEQETWQSVPYFNLRVILAMTGYSTSGLRWRAEHFVLILIHGPGTACFSEPSKHKRWQQTGSALLGSERTFS